MFWFDWQVSLNYQQYFLQPVVHYVCDKQPEVRQAASYGVGIMAQFGGQGYSQALTGRQVVDAGRRAFSLRDKSVVRQLPRVVFMVRWKQASMCSLIVLPDTWNCSMNCLICLSDLQFQALWIFAVCSSGLFVTWKYLVCLFYYIVIYITGCNNG